MRAGQGRGDHSSKAHEAYAQYAQHIKLSTCVQACSWPSSSVCVSVYNMRVCVCV